MTSTDAPGGVSLLPPPTLARRLFEPDAMAARQARADRILAAEGAGHLVHDLPVRADGRAATVESRPWRVDPVPVTLDAGTFQWLSLAVSERMEALEAVVADLYGARTLLRERVVPPEVVAATDRYRIDAVGTPVRRWISTLAVDVVLDASGMWWHVQDLVDAPPGLGYALLDRSVMSRVLPDLTARADVISLSRFGDRLRGALAATSPVESPRIVLFSGGLDHPSYIDHSFLAVELGINLVEGADLVVRQRRVWLRTLDGLEPIDVLYRRLDDPFIDPLGRASQGVGGVPGLLLAHRAGGVALANAHGTGVLEDPAVSEHLAAAIERLRPTSQVLPTLPAADVPPLTPVPLASATASGERRHAGVTIRLFAVHDGERVSVLPGGTGRVLADGDHPARPTACAAKDVWVLGWTPPPAVPVPRLPQVDFGRSVPTRAAAALYWSNRSAERAEVMARTMRVIMARVEQDPGLAALDGGRWCRRMGSMLHAARPTNGELVEVDSVEALNAQLVATGAAIADEIGTVLTESTTVREFLSVTAGRVLSRLAELRTTMREEQPVIVDDLDAVLADFAAMAGLWQESTVRGPAWRIGDTGRRLERCLVVLDLLEGALSGDGATTEVQEATIQVLLASNDSLVAYRRRHRSEVETELALRLLVHDSSNPRSLAAAIGQLAVHAGEGEPALGGGFVGDARRALELPVERMIPALRSVLDDAGQRVIGRWFSTPVNPIEMTSHEVVG